MGAVARQRGFDEDDAVAAAGRLFTARGYEGTSVDDLVAGLGVHRGSLYRTFGSKLELFHRALRTHVERELLPWIVTLGESPDPLTAATSGRGPDVGLLLVAAVERAPTDPVAADEVALVVDALTAAVGGDDDALAAALAAALLGLWLRRRAGARPTDVRRAAAALAALART